MIAKERIDDDAFGAACLVRYSLCGAKNLFARPAARKKKFGGVLLLPCDDSGGAAPINFSFFPSFAIMYVASFLRGLIESDARSCQALNLSRGSQTKRSSGPQIIDNYHSSLPLVLDTHS